MIHIVVTVAHTLFTYIHFTQYELITHMMILLTHTLGLYYYYTAT